MHVVSTHVCIVHGFLSLLPSLRGLPGHRAATVYNKPAANKVGTGPFQERTPEYRNEGNAQLDGLANKLWDKTLVEGPTMKTAVTAGYFPINPLLLYRAFQLPYACVKALDTGNCLLHSEAALVPSHLNNLHSEHAAVVPHRNNWISMLSSSSKHTLVNLLQALFKRNIHSSQGALVTKKQRTLQCCQVL